MAGCWSVSQLYYFFTHTFHWGKEEEVDEMEAGELSLLAAFPGSFCVSPFVSRLLSELLLLLRWQY